MFQYVVVKSQVFFELAKTFPGEAYTNSHNYQYHIHIKSFVKLLNKILMAGIYYIERLS